MKMVKTNDLKPRAPRENKSLKKDLKMGKKSSVQRNATVASHLSSVWKYRRTIHLNPPTCQSNYAVLVTLTVDIMGNPYTHIKKDGSDLRFTGPDGKTLLNYWIELWNNTGISRIWVQVEDPGTAKIYMDYGNPNANSFSDGTSTFDFFDDFDDGIWAKYSKNPILTRTEPWEARAICEPSVIYEDSIFKMWYMGCKTSAGCNAALGYATSKDGFTWKKHPDNPILRDTEDAIIRPTVLKHNDTYYLFASDYQWNEAAGVINRWTSRDGINWTNKTTVLRPTELWEGHFHNTGIIVDDDGTWKMLYTTDGPFGYAYSSDGLHWTKYGDNPVITGFYGGDPCLRKIGNEYYTWYSREHNHHLRICCSLSTDMIHWTEVYNNPQIGYTELWERGVGRPEVHWDRHLTDADLCEHNGKVFMYYQGAQDPFGIAIFNGTLSQLATRLAHPPLLKWTESPYGCVENKELKISDSETGINPFHEKVTEFNDQTGYVIEYRARCYAGYRQEQSSQEKEGWSSQTKCYADSSHQVQVVMRYIDKNSFACFWMRDDNTTYYQECIGGVFGDAINIGANNICDADWHSWKVVVNGDNNQLYINGKYIGAHKSSSTFLNRADSKIGFSVYNTYASFDDVRVRKYCSHEPTVEVGIEESRKG